MNDRLGQRVDKALDAQRRGRIEVEADGHSAEVEVVEADTIGVRVRRVAVTAPRESLEELAGALPERLRSLPERVVPIEVDATLGGASLRTDPREMRDREYFEVEVRGEEVSVERYRVGDDGREKIEFDLTRRQLGKIVDELD